jgi:hypothetical protein
MNEPEQFADERIITTLEEYGCSWRDHILVGTPPSVCRWSPESGLTALLIEDDGLSAAVTAFLARHEARRFDSIDEIERVFGWDGLATCSRPDRRCSSAGTGRRSA